MGVIKKLLGVVVLFIVTSSSLLHAKSAFEEIYDKKKQQIEAKELTFDYSHDLKLFQKAEGTFVEAFLPRAVALDKDDVDDEKELEEELRESHHLIWNNFYDELRKNKALGKTEYFYAVKNKKEEVVAFVYFRGGDSSEDKHISFLAVHPDYERMGLGTLLIFSIFEKFSNLQMVTLKVDTEKNEKVISFYNKLGFYEYNKVDDLRISFALERNCQKNKNHS